MDLHQGSVSLLARLLPPSPPPPRVSARSDPGRARETVGRRLLPNPSRTMASRLPVIERSDWVTLSRVTERRFTCPIGNVYAIVL